MALLTMLMLSLANDLVPMCNLHGVQVLILHKHLLNTLLSLLLASICPFSVHLGHEDSLLGQRLVICYVEEPMIQSESRKN